MDTGAINKGKGKGKHKGEGKGKKGNKGKVYGQQGYGYGGQGKGKGPIGQTVQYKNPATMHKEKEKDKERQTAKEKHIQQAATDLANKVTRQKTAELQCTTYKRTAKKTTTMQQGSGMDHRPPMTTSGGPTTKHKLMQCSNHNNLHFQHLHN